MKAHRFLALTASVGAIAVIYFVGIRPRLLAEAALDDHARADTHPVVNVAVAKSNSAATDLLLPASLQPFQDTSIYARTDGYLAKWLADLGDHVKAGQVLAAIDAPEVNQQLAQARANLTQARANLELARVSADRWKALGQQNAVAKQDVDEKLAALSANEADVLAAEANVQRLSQLTDYLTISAPFEGVVTARNTEVGMLVSAGAGRELFHLVQTDPLRVYVNVPQSYARSIRPGLDADVTIAEFPAQTFRGKVVRFAGALDAATRTLRTEVQLPNPDGRLLAGMFGQVKFRVPAGDPAVLIPSNAVIIRADGTLVAVVGDDNTLHFQKIRLGRDFGTQVEIASGLAAGARVVANPSDALTDGLVVTPVVPGSVAQKG